MDRTLTFHLKKKLLMKLEEGMGATFLKLGTCSFHPVHTTFRKGITKIPFDYDKFFYELHFFKKNSSARGESYALLQSVTNIVAEYAKHETYEKYVPTRWITMKYVCL